MRQRNAQRSLSERLTFLSLLALPVIGLPIFPSSYRPLSAVLLIIPIGFLFLTIIYRGRIKWWPEDLALVLFLTFSGLRSIFGPGFGHSQLQEAVFETGLLVFGGASFFCFRALVFSLGASLIIRAMNAVAIILILIGVWEALTIYGPLPDQLRDEVMRLFNGKVGSRLQLSTPEAAWAGRVLLPYLLCLWTYRHRINKTVFATLFGSGCVVYVMTLSLESYITAAVTLLVAVLLFPTKKTLFRAVALSSSFVVLAILSSGFFVSQLVERNNVPYYVSRISKVMSLPEFSFELIAKLDESTFVRLNYPKIAFEVFAKHPAIGVGNGYYDDVFPNFISARGDLPYDNRQIVSDIVNGTGDPRILYGRILAENGLIGGVLFFGFLGTIYLRLLQRRRECSEPQVLARLLFAASLAGGLQFASLIYLQNWFIWAFCSGICINANLVNAPKLRHQTSPH